MSDRNSAGGDLVRSDNWLRCLSARRAPLLGGILSWIVLLLPSSTRSGLVRLQEGDVGGTEIEMS